MGEPRPDQADRVRALMPPGHAVREVRMFGGLSFMVDEQLAVCVMKDGSLLVRVGDEDGPELAARPGAAPAEMGRGRVMGPGWVTVRPAALETPEALADWVGLALDYNRSRPRG